MALKLSPDEVSRVAAALLPKLRQQGPEWRGVPCPIHGGDDPENFVVNAKTGAFRCFSRGCSGDLVDVAKAILGLSNTKEALDQVEAMAGRQPGVPGAPPPPPHAEASKETSEWAGPMRFDQCPPPKNAKGVSAFDGKGQAAGYLATTTWPYYDAQGLLLMVDVRRERTSADGQTEKQVVIFTVWRDRASGRLFWRQRGIPKDLANSKPLWNLPGLAHRPDALVIVAEGCKAAEAAGKLFPDLVAVSWPGGVAGVAHASWSALAGRRVVFWPDADAVGRKAALEGAALALEAGATSAVVVQVPEDAPKGWDLADVAPTGWDLAKMLADAQPVGAAAAPDLPPGGPEGSDRLPESVAALRIADPLLWQLRYDAQADAWWAYEPARGIWSEAPKAEAQALAARAIETTRCAPRGYGARYVNSTLELSRRHLRSPKTWAKEEAFANGVLVNGQLQPHGPQRLLTYACEFDWNPALDVAPVKAWLLGRVGGDEAVVQVLRAFWTCALRGVNPGIILELLGPGATGKSTYVRLCTLLVGFHATLSTSLPMLESRPFELANARGRRLVQINDADRYGGPVGALKQLTGEDLVRAEIKGKQRAAAFRFDGVVVLTANEPLRSSDYSSGLARRRVTVNFSIPVPAAERRDIEAEFTPLLPAMYHWAMSLSTEEALAILRTARERVHAIGEATAAAEEETNPLAAWALEKLWLTPGISTEVGSASWMPPSRSGYSSEVSEGCFIDHTEKLYPSYCQWAKTSGLQQISVQRFGRDLADLLVAQWKLSGVEKIKNLRGNMAYMGVALKAYLADSMPLREAVSARRISGGSGGLTGGLTLNPPGPQTLTGPCSSVSPEVPEDFSKSEAEKTQILDGAEKQHDQSRGIVERRIEVKPPEPPGDPANPVQGKLWSPGGFPEALPPSPELNLGPPIDHLDLLRRREEEDDQ